jgi:glucan phosphorylase
MPDNSDTNMPQQTLPRCSCTYQHAAIEEVTKGLSENGVGIVAAYAIAAMETLDKNAQGITDAIMRLRQLSSSNALLLILQ